MDHRTNQQIQPNDLENTIKTCAAANENNFSVQPIIQHPRNSISHDFNEGDIYPCHMRSEADNGYSSSIK